MFGFSDIDTINHWLTGAKENREMDIDCPEVKQMIQAEITRTKEFAKKRIKELEDLLNNKKYFS